MDSLLDLQYMTSAQWISPGMHIDLRNVNIENRETENGLVSKLD